MSTRPLSGIGVGRTTSKALMRSDATSSRRASSSAKMSRTLPERTKPGTSSASGMGVILQLFQSIDERVATWRSSVAIVETGRDLGGRQDARDIGVGLDQLAQLSPLVRGAQRGPLDDPVGVLARQARPPRRASSAAGCWRTGPGRARCSRASAPAARPGRRRGRGSARACSAAASSRRAARRAPPTSG